MLKSITKTMLLLLFMSVFTQAQWTNQGAWPDGIIKSSNHAMATDADGKIWVGDYYGEKFVTPNNDTLVVRLIKIYNPDGTQASFSPIWKYDDGVTVDTLNTAENAGLGMHRDIDGNILYVMGKSGMNFLCKFDYKTGAAIKRVELGYEKTAAGPAVSADGTIFVASVFAGYPLKMYDKDLNAQGNALEATKGFSRGFEVSSDGLKIYWAGYTNSEVRIYSRPDEFSSFDTNYTPIMSGAACEAMAWQPGTGYLWMGGGSYMNLPTPGSGFTPGSYYAYDVTNNAVVDSMAQIFATAGDANQRPRTIAFSLDGNTAYIGAFGGNGAYEQVQKVTKAAGAPVSVTFNVNMKVAADKGTFVPGTDAVHIAGNLNGWNTTATEMTDPDNDKIYSVKIDTFKTGQNLEFKFIKGADGWEGIDNRKYTVPASNSIFTAYFNNDSVSATKEIDVVFAADMTYEIGSGRFNPLTDTLSARGSFNGWSSADILAPSTTNPSIYEVIKKIATYAGETFNYKFAYITNAGINWEGDPNKTYTVTADDITNGYAYASRVYNNLTDTSFVKQNCVINFAVDMTGAVSSVTGSPFSAIENVVICGANPPLKWPSGGWPNTDENLVIKLFNDGTNGDLVAGDNVWSKDITFSKYSPLKIQYKFGANYALASNTGSNDNESSTGTDHYIYMTPDMTKAYVGNKWSVMGTHALSPTGVETYNNQIPTVYSLEQNFPNPFNPSTSIRFSVPEEGLVTLRVFNILGQEIGTLVNEVKNAGNFTVSFDASRLSSGTYFYSISTKNYTATKKMMLVK